MDASFMAFDSDFMGNEQGGSGIICSIIEPVSRNLQIVQLEVGLGLLEGHISPFDAVGDNVFAVFVGQAHILIPSSFTFS